MSETPKPVYLNRKEAADYLTSIGCPMAPQTLANMASNNNAGKGPPYTKVSWKKIHYLQSDLDAWAKQYVVRVE